MAAPAIGAAPAQLWSGSAIDRPAAHCRKPERLANLAAGSGGAASMMAERLSAQSF